MRNIGNACKWIFGSLAIALAVYNTKDPICLWAFALLVASEVDY